jgi:hypothetical protein
MKRLMTIYDLEDIGSEEFHRICIQLDFFVSKTIQHELQYEIDDLTYLPHRRIDIELEASVSDALKYKS